MEASILNHDDHLVQIPYEIAHLNDLFNLNDSCIRKGL